MGASARTKEFLDGKGISYEILEHLPAYTAQEVAAVTHISGYDVAKVVMVKVGGEFVMAVLPAAKQLDLDALQKLMGSQQHPRLANEQEFGSLFPDCELGAEPPFGNLYDVPVVVDQQLTQEEQIAFNAGSHREIMQIGYTDYARLVQPRVGSIARPD